MRDLWLEGGTSFGVWRSAPLVHGLFRMGVGVGAYVFRSCRRICHRMGVVVKLTVTKVRPYTCAALHPSSNLPLSPKSVINLCVPALSSHLLSCFT